MGSDDLINRFSQIQPKVLVTQDRYVHAAKEINRLDVIERAEQEIDSIERIIRIGQDANALLSSYEPRSLNFIRRDFNHPLYILFSSGSTGAPKCFEHSSGGVLFKAFGGVSIAL